jgi:hypothetical protein
MPRTVWLVRPVRAAWQWWSKNKNNKKTHDTTTPLLFSVANTTYAPPAAGQHRPRRVVRPPRPTLTRPGEPSVVPVPGRRVREPHPRPPRPRPPLGGDGGGGRKQLNPPAPGAGPCSPHGGGAEAFQQYTTQPTPPTGWRVERRRRGEKGSSEGVALKNERKKERGALRPTDPLPPPGAGGGGGPTGVWARRRGGNRRRPGRRTGPRAERRGGRGRGRGGPVHKPVRVVAHVGPTPPTPSAAPRESAGCRLLCRLSGLWGSSLWAVGGWLVLPVLWLWAGWGGELARGWCARLCCWAGPGRCSLWVWRAGLGGCLLLWLWCLLLVCWAGSAAPVLQPARERGASWRNDRLEPAGRRPRPEDVSRARPGRAKDMKSQGPEGPGPPGADLFAPPTVERDFEKVPAHNPRSCCALACFFALLQLRPALLLLLSASFSACFLCSCIMPLLWVAQNGRREGPLAAGAPGAKTGRAGGRGLDPPVENSGPPVNNPPQYAPTPWGLP